MKNLLPANINDTIMIVGSVAILALFVWLFRGFFVGETIDRRRGNTNLARQFVEQASSGRYDEAYAHMTPGYRAKVSPEVFAEKIEANTYFGGLKSFAFNEYSEVDGTAKLVCVLKGESSEVLSEFHYSRENDQWGIVGLTIGGKPALP